MDKTENIVTPAKPARRSRKWLWIAGGLVVFLAAAYFIVTSSAFLKAVVLPRVGKAINAGLTADQVSLSPFSQLAIRGLKLQTTGTEPVLRADEAQVRYGLWSIIRGNIVVPEIKLTSPHLVIIQNADGTSNLDPLLKKNEKEPTSPKPKGTAPLQLALDKISLSQGSVSWVQFSKNGDKQSAELANLNIGVDQVKNEQSGKLTLAMDLKYEQNKAASKTNAASINTMQAKISGSYDFKLAKDLLPQSINGATRMEVAQAQGDWRDLATVNGVLECQLTPTAIENLALRFERGGNALGQLRLSGPVNLERSEARIKIELASIDRQLLNVYGASKGWDFGQTTLSSSNLVDITQEGKVIAATGLIAARQFSVSQKTQKTPAVNLEAQYQVNIDLKSQTALVQQLSLTGMQGAKELLKASVDKPMSIPWGATAIGFKDSSFQMSVTNLNLADWNFLMGDSAPTGLISLSGQVVTQKDGKQLALALNTQARNLSARMGTNALALARFDFQLKGQLDDLGNAALVTFDSYSVEAADQDQSLVSCKGSGTYNFKSGDLKLNTSLDASLAALVKKYPMDAVTVTAGKVSFTGLVTQEKQAQTIVGKLSLSDFTGRYADYRLSEYKATLDMDAQMQNQQVKISRASLSAGQGANSGGSVTLTGAYDLNRKAGQFSYTITDLNSFAIGPFLTPALAPRTLVSGSITSSGTASVDPQGKSALKADLKLANLVLKDPAKTLPEAPLNAQLQIDGTLGQLRQLTLSQLDLALRDATGSGGQFNLTGTVDLSNKVSQVNFKLLDLNQRALGPFAGPMLAPKTLATVNINATGSAVYDPQKDASLKLDMSISNLVVNDPEKKLPATPMAAQLRVDGSLSKGLADVRQFILNLPPTARATNQIQLTGRLDLTQTNVTSGQLSLQSESVDVTPLYDLFTSTATNAPATTAATTKTASTGTSASASAAKTQPMGKTEPAATVLPFQKFGVNLKIDRLYLREVAITNWQAAVAINGGQIGLDPFQLTLNGAPIKVNGAFNLGVPGYTYDLTLQMDKLSIEPLVNTFSPALRGQYQAEIKADAQLKGAGITDANLQKNLAGQVTLGVTNASVNLLNPKAKFILTPIALALQMKELLDSPLTALGARAQIGQGQVNVQQLVAYSSAFQIESPGTIKLASILTNSTLDMPVTLNLKRSLSDSAKLTPAGTAPAVDFVKLPSFVKVAGTLGAPEAKVDKLAAAQLGIRSIGGLSGGSGTKLGSTLDGVGNLLGGNTSGLTNQLMNLLPKGRANALTTTNITTGTITNTNAISATNLFRNILSNTLPAPKGATNAPTNVSTGALTNTNAISATNRLQNILTNALPAPKGATNQPTNTAPINLIRGLFN